MMISSRCTIKLALISALVVLASAQPQPADGTPAATDKKLPEAVLEADDVTNPATPDDNNTTTPATTTSTTTETTTSTSTTAKPAPTPEPPTPSPPNTTTTTTTTTSTTPSTTSSTTTLAPPTPAPNTTTTAVPPTTTTPAPTPVPHCKRFDAYSFVGGIILAYGSLAISIVLYKFYTMQRNANNNGNSSSNYRTL
ncbi:integumentary mucin C.1-like [Anopheles bellator]|uniref:integumentary mucin C.1-like n=1 Tax=Anopheles bellator TaxID=139047 RepID=UPI002647C78D|nr:integumentary mucin C.1-like [Anopheles bellator]